MNKYFDSPRNGVFYIAEIGGNHEGNFGYAEKLVRLAIETGVDAVKLQIYRGDKLVSPLESPDRVAHFERFELEKDQYIHLAEMCLKNGVVFIASVWDRESFEWAEKYIPILKVGSGDLTAYPLIELLVATGKPIILSTGLSNMEEIKRTVNYIRALDRSYIDDRKLAVLQCTSCYPTPDNEANLNVITNLASTFEIPIGYSDHTVGTDAILAAAAMGASVIEAHFTDTRDGKTFRDHQISSTPKETQEVLRRLRRLHILRGSPNKAPTPSEISSGHVKSFRRSVYASKPIAVGEIFSRANLTVLRPENGVPAYRYDEILGQISSRDIDANEVLREEDLK